MPPYPIMLRAADVCRRVRHGETVSMQAAQAEGTTRAYPHSCPRKLAPRHGSPPLKRSTSHPETAGKMYVLLPEHTTDATDPASVEQMSQVGVRVEGMNLTDLASHLPRPFGTRGTYSLGQLSGWPPGAVCDRGVRRNRSASPPGPAPSWAA